MTIDFRVLSAVLAVGVLSATALASGGEDARLVDHETWLDHEAERWAINYLQEQHRDAMEWRAETGAEHWPTIEELHWGFQVIPAWREMPTEDYRVADFVSGAEFLVVLEPREPDPDRRIFAIAEDELLRATSSVERSQEDPREWETIPPELEPVASPQALEMAARLTLRAIGSSQHAYAETNREKRYGSFNAMVRTDYIQNGYTRKNMIPGYYIPIFQAVSIDKPARYDPTITVPDHHFLVVAAPNDPELGLATYAITEDQTVREAPEWFRLDQGMGFPLEWPPFESPPPLRQPELPPDLVAYQRLELLRDRGSRVQVDGLGRLTGSLDELYAHSPTDRTDTLTTYIPGYDIITWLNWTGGDHSHHWLVVAAPDSIHSDLPTFALVDGWELFAASPGTLVEPGTKVDTSEWKPAWYR